MESLASFWRFEQWRRILQLRQEEYHEFASCEVHFVFWEFPTSHRCFAFFWAHSNTDDHTSGQIVPVLEVT